MNKYLVELIGTFFLFLTIGLTTGLGHAGDLGPLVIGCVLTAMIFAGGHISAAHYNPAVTLAFWLRGKCPSPDVAPYIGAQLLGALSAALTIGFLAGGATFTATRHDVGPAIVAEVLFTFALCWVILNVATSTGTEGNSFYGLAIGLTVTGGIYAVGPISGAVFNPAVAVGLAVMGLAEWGSIWVYFVAQTLAAVIAAFAFKSLAKN